MRPRATTLDSLAAYNPISSELTGRGEPLQVPAIEVSPNFFDTLGIGSYATTTAMFENMS